MCDYYPELEKMPEEYYKLMNDGRLKISPNLETNNDICCVIELDKKIICVIYLDREGGETCSLLDCDINKDFLYDFLQDISHLFYTLDNQKSETVCMLSKAFVNCSIKKDCYFISRSLSISGESYIGNIIEYSDKFELLDKLNNKIIMMVKKLN